MGIEKLTSVQMLVAETYLVFQEHFLPNAELDLGREQKHISILSTYFVQNVKK